MLRGMVRKVDSPCEVNPQVVKAGDTLYGLLQKEKRAGNMITAEEFKAQNPDLFERNKDENLSGNFIQIGDELCLAPPGPHHTLQSHAELHRKAVAGRVPQEVDRTALPEAERCLFDVLTLLQEEPKDEDLEKAQDGFWIITGHRPRSADEAEPILRKHLDALKAKFEDHQLQIIPTLESIRELTGGKGPLPNYDDALALLHLFDCVRYKDHAIHNQEFDEAIKEAARAFGIDWRELKAVAVHESELDPKRCRSSGELGLAQLRPETATDVMGWLQARNSPFAARSEFTDLKHILRAWKPLHNEFFGQDPPDVGDANQPEQVELAARFESYQALQGQLEKEWKKLLVIPEINLFLAAAYLAELRYGRFQNKTGGQKQMVFAAYNRGPYAEVISIPRWYVQRIAALGAYYRATLPPDS